MKSDLHILGVDPGGTTGIVYCRLPPKGALVVEHWIEERDMFLVGDMLNDWINGTNGYERLVICEAFIDHSTPHAVDSNHPVQTIGMLRWLVRQADVKMELPNPQARLAVGEPSVKAAGYWIRGGAGHARQALRHALAWCIRQQHTPTILQLFPKGDDN